MSKERIGELEAAMKALADDFEKRREPFRVKYNDLREKERRRYHVSPELVVHYDPFYEGLVPFRPDRENFTLRLEQLTSAELHLYAEVKALIEFWRGDEVEDLPPSGTWLQAKIALLHVKGDYWMRKNILCEDC